MAVRNERPCLANCLDHLIENGVDYFIVDNESDDGSSDLLRLPRYSRHLVGLETYPFAGMFDWAGILTVLDRAAAGLDADWAILTAPDEILHPYSDETLSDAVARMDTAGFDAIDFNEFVFLPLDNNYQVDANGPQAMRSYYFFEPRPNRLIRARRVSRQLSWIESGGHRLRGRYRLADETFALRHYMFRSQEHALAKYAGRVFKQDELARGWHRNRSEKLPETFLFPPRSALEFIEDPSTKLLSLSNPRKRHYWEWE